MQILSRRGYTLMEIMLVLTVIGILVSALFPSYTAYQKRGRDTSRLSHLSSIGKMINSHIIDKEVYPNHVVGCVDSTALSKYGNVPTDPLTTNDNGCGTVTRSYAYGSSATLIQSSNEFAIIAKMENLNGGNTGSIAGLTGAITQTGYTSIRANMAKGAGQYYVITK